MHHGSNPSRWQHGICILIALVGLIIFGSTIDVQAREALHMEEIPGLYQRILTLPGAKMHKQPKADAPPIAHDLQPPVLTPLYVYERKTSGGTEWLACGKKTKDGELGWIEEPYTETWKMQLVVKLTPRGNLAASDRYERTERVVFYRDADTISQLMRDKKVVALANRDMKDIQAGKPDLNRIVAVEPETPADPSAKAHIIPVIDYRYAGFNRKVARISKNESPIFDVALLNLTDNKLVQKGTKGLDHAKGKPDRRALKDFKIGLVFVMDTTASMTNYIKYTRETIREVYKKLKKDGTVGNVTFGLVGYRDYVSGCPQKPEYVTRIYQDLDPDMAPETVLKNLETVNVGSTCGFQEDMYAGLKTAVDDMNWQPFQDGAKFIVVITDASAREPGDPHSMVDAYDAERLRFVIKNKDIQVFPLYLRTPEAEKRGDFKRGKAQFEKQEWGKSRLQVIPGQDADAFKRKIGGFVNAVSTAVSAAVHGQMPEREESNPGEQTRLEDLVVNEIFKAQMKYLGRQSGADTQAYFRGWVSKIDLTLPEKGHDAVKGYYLLSRNQLNDLSKRVQEIITLFDARENDPESLRRKMVEMASNYGTDPNMREINILGDTGVLPDYLAKLPYKSTIMSLSADDWASRGADQKQKTLEHLKRRLLIYRTINKDSENWIDLGEGQRELEVFPIPIEEFP